MSNSANQKAQAAEARRLLRCMADVVDAAAKDILAAVMKRMPDKTWQSGAKAGSLLAEYTRDEAIAFGDRLHTRIVELLGEAAKEEKKDGI